MIALQITSLKILMNQLLTGNTFDSFLLEEAMIRTANTYTIDGRIHPEFYPPDERTADLLPYEFQPWSDIKGLCFHLIKGKHTPLSFKFILHWKPENTAALLQKEQSDVDASQVKALVLTIRFDGTKAVLTTGTAFHTFLLSREPDAIWDKAVTKYLSQKGILFEELSTSSS